MKIYLSKINESWIVDRIREDWYKNNKNISTKFAYNSDIIWIISPWTWKKIPIKYLNKKYVVCSIYHINEDKFSDKLRNEFSERDKYVDFYHTISFKSKAQIEEYTNKKVTSIPFWIDPKIWFHKTNKIELRKKYGFSKSDYLVGSFQRDTEGYDLKTPKLEKGPDIFINNVIELKKVQQNLVVVLTGKRRQYVISRLKNLNIKYKYFEMVDQKTLNDLYNSLDLYIVSSRVEGGPQSIMESAITKTPIVSTDVGVASEILSEKSIYNNNFYQAKPDVEFAYMNSLKYHIPEGMDNFVKYFKNIYEN